MENSNLEVQEQEGNGKEPFQKFWYRKGMKKKHSQNSGTGKNEREPFPKCRSGKGMKNIILTFREWESEDIVPRNSRKREREWKEKQKIMIT